MANEIFTRIQLKYDSYANWTNANPVLLAGEIAIAEIPGTTYTKHENDTAVVVQNPPHILFKVGPGAFNSLDWTSAKAADVYAWAKQAALPVERADAEGVTEGNVIAGIKFENGKIKYTTATVATSEGLANLISRVNGLENTMATDGELEAAVNTINGIIATLATKAELEGVDSKFANYYTKEEANTEFATPAEVIAEVNKALADVSDADTITNITTLVEYVNENAGDLAAIIEEVYGSKEITGNSRIDTAVANAANAVSVADEASTVAGTANATANQALEIANEAKTIAGNAESGAVAAKNAAEVAQSAAESARDAAVAAQGAAETAKSGAVEAQGKAEAARDAAVIAQGAAENARDLANTKAGEAAASAETANTKAGEATTAAQTATEKADDASASAATASEAAATATQKAADADASAQAAANSATAAGEAQAAAEKAKDDANVILGQVTDAATGAQTTANEAKELATQAKNTADAAKEAADAAKEVTDGLHTIATSGSIYDVTEGAHDNIGTDKIDHPKYLVFNCGTATTVI